MTLQACELPATGPAAILATSLQAALRVIDNARLRAPVSYNNPKNARSIALAERLGAQPDGQIADKDGVTLIYRHAKKETEQS